MNWDRDKLEAVLKAIARIEPSELDCECVLDLFCALCEAKRRGLCGDSRLEAVKRHLENCADCREEFDCLCKCCDEAPEPGGNGAGQKGRASPKA